MSTASRLVHVTTAVSVALSTLVSGVPSSLANTFSDVPSTHEFYSYVEKLVSLGAVSGQSGVFRINDNLTRAELCKIAVLAARIPLQSSGLPTFSDVSTSHSLYAYVETAARTSIVSGIGGGLFLPDAPVTRGAAAKIITNAFALPLNTTGGPHFSDVGTQHSFYVYVETLFNAGVVSGIGAGMFGVDMTVTRGQVAKMVAKTYDVVGAGTNPPPSGDSNIIGLTSAQTSQCVLDRIVTKKDTTNNIIVQAYTSGKSASINQPIGVIIKVTDLNGRPVPSLSLKMEVTEGNSGNTNVPYEVGRSGVYLGSYTSNSTGGTITGSQVSLLISEQSSNYSRPAGYEDVKAFPPVTISFPLLQSGRIGSVSTICWDLTREKMTIDPNISNTGLDDYIVIIGLAEDGNQVGVPTGINMTLFSTSNSSGTSSSYSSAGGFYVFRYQPSDYNSSNNTVVVKRLSDHQLQIITNFRVFSSDQMHTETTLIPRS